MIFFITTMIIFILFVKFLDNKLRLKWKWPPHNNVGYNKIKWIKTEEKEEAIWGRFTLVAEPFVSFDSSVKNWYTGIIKYTTINKEIRSSRCIKKTIEEVQDSLIGYCIDNSFGFTEKDEV